MISAERARSIYQAHLDCVTRAVWGRHYDQGAAEMLYPMYMRTPDADVVVDHPDDLAHDMSLFRSQLEEWGATDYGRRCLMASVHPTERNRIDGAHRTTILRRGALVFAPYVCALTLRCVGGIWRGEAVIVPDAPKRPRFHHTETPR